MKKEEIELLEQALYFINQIPRRHIFGGKYKDSYTLASEITKFLKQVEKDDTRKG